MSNKSDPLWSELRVKVSDADKRLKEEHLSASAKSKTARWQEQRNAKPLARRDDRSEQYAIAALQIAAVATDAERSAASCRPLSRSHERRRRSCAADERQRRERCGRLGPRNHLRTVI